METNQQIFDAAWNGLKAQGFIKAVIEGDPVWGGDEVCTWQNRRGHRCAIGHVNAVFRGDAFNWGDIESWTLKRESLQYQLREAHNSATSPANMECRLRDVARAFRLVVPDDGFAAFKARILAPLPVTVE